MRETMAVGLDSDFANQLVEEHHRLGEVRSRLRRLLEDCLKHPSHRVRGDLKQVFEDFRDRIEEHMEFEERDGFMSPLLDVRPNLAGRVEELLEEHARIRRDHQKLSAFLNQTGDFSYPVMEIVLRIADDLDFVEAHERAENALVLEAFCQETGNKD